MEMTFDQYINNPMGIKNSVISNREMYRTMYTEKLSKILLRENGKVSYQLFRNKTNFFIYIKIPSEAIEDFYYDVVVEFYPPKDRSVGPERTLSNYNVRFFSNDPSFVFTFAHAFIKNNMFMNDLKPKMSKEAVKRNADERNPQNTVGYVKSLYFAYLIMKQRGLFQKVLYEAVPLYNKDELLKHIEYADDKIRDRQKAYEEKQKAKKRKKKPDILPPQLHNNNTNDNPFAIKRTKTISNVNKTRTTANSKTKTGVKRTKYSKTI